MTEIGIRALKQNASAVVRGAASGETITVTDRGRPVARISPIPARPLDQLLATGDARPPVTPFSGLPRPAAGPALSAELARMRDDERW